MKTEICQFCLRSGILCSKCKDRVERGEISQTDLKIAKMLISLEEKFPSLQDIYFYKAIESDGILAIIVREQDIQKFLNYSGRIRRFLEKKIEKRIRILGHNSDDRKFLEDLFAPSRILAINKIWLPDGTTMTRVILRRKIRINLNALEEIANKIQGISLRIEFAD